MVKYAELIHGMEQITPGTTSNPNSSIPQFRIWQPDKPIYYAGTKMIRFIARVHSDNVDTKKGANSTYRRPQWYNVEIDFKDVKQETGLNPQEIQKRMTPRPSLSNNDIMVRCNCINNRFRVDFANRRVKAAVGTRPPVYHRLWPGEHLNDNTPMICKHAVAYVKWLLRNNFITE